MHSRRRILMATLALISLASEVTRSSPAAAASHYPLWVCPERYGGWGWSRPRDLFGGLTLDRIVSTLGNPPAYWYRVDNYLCFYNAFPGPYCFVIPVNDCGPTR